MKPVDKYLEGVNKIDNSNLARAVADFEPLAMSGKRWSANAIRNILNKYFKD